jgi:hypothetical protein
VSRRRAAARADDTMLVRWSWTVFMAGLLSVDR